MSRWSCSRSHSRGLLRLQRFYVPELAKHFARAFASALDRDFRADAEGPRISGVESVVANDLLLSGSWREVLAVALATTVAYQHLGKSFLFDSSPVPCSVWTRLTRLPLQCPS